MNEIPVGILGASGYAGRELCRLVHAHPGLDLVFAAANEQRDAILRLGRRELRFVAAEDAPLGSARLIFSALPHGASEEWVRRASDAGARVVDLSADFRPGNGPAHRTIPYGLTEQARGAVSGAAIVANPGCYPTAILLALAPLVEQGLIADGATIVVNAASGVSGAGNAPKRELLFGEVTEDFRPYAVGNTHRHLAEMRETLRAWGTAADLAFTPHLLPVARGILAAITVPLRAPLANPLGPWREAYTSEPFIEVSPEPPALHDVVRRNVVRLSAHLMAGTRQPMLTVLAAIDNMLKGSAGQAVQNANLMLGLPETMGLPA